MSPSSTRRSPVPRRTLRAVLAAACVLAIALPARAATRPVQYVPVYVPLVVIHCPKLNLNPFKARPKNLGYLPVVGNSALRWVEAEADPRPVEPPPMVLYNPVEPAKTPATEPAKPVATEPVTTDSEPTETPAQPKKLRAEDFLPFFEGSGEMRGAPGDADGSAFVPARPVLPESRAEFRQK